MQKKRVTILGSTGSIGRQALAVLARFPERFQVHGLAAGKNLVLLKEQARKFRPEIISIQDPARARELEKSLPGKLKVLTGEEGLNELAGSSRTDLVLSALAGAEGLKPLLQAVEARKNVALANKEPMVMAGKLIMSRARKKGVSIIPVDSEHSAIFQLLARRPRSEIRRVWLSASGGPFLHKKPAELVSVSVSQALRHPTWKMGRKISVDSATLMNKALELLEARWLFGLAPEQLKVIVHPQSIVHSLVEMCDGAMFAHLSIPDMKIPIAFALFYPQRPELEFPAPALTEISSLNFEKPDLKNFPALKLGFVALKAGGTLPAAMNAANETAVAAFLEGRIGFTQIVEIVAGVMAGHKNIEPRKLAQVLEADRWARRRAGELARG